MAYTPDGKVTREPLGQTGTKRQGTWTFSQDGFCTTWPGSTQNCYKLVKLAENKWSVRAESAELAIWSREVKINPQIVEQFGPLPKPVARQTQVSQATPTTSTTGMVFTPWSKVCQSAQSKVICYTGRVGAISPGQATIAVAIVEDNPKKVLRVTLKDIPSSPSLNLTIDQHAITARFRGCSDNLCQYELEVDAASIQRLKGGKVLVAQNAGERRVGYEISLVGFTSAFNGAPTDAKALEIDAAKRDEQLRQHAEGKELSARAAEAKP
jgi:invasion protein IalB